MRKRKILTAFAIGGGGIPIFPTKLTPVGRVPLYLKQNTDIEHFLLIRGDNKTPIVVHIAKRLKACTHNPQRKGSLSPWAYWL